MLQAISCQSISTKGSVPEFISKPVIRKPRAISVRARRIAKAMLIFRELFLKYKKQPDDPSFAWKNHLANTKKNLIQILGLLAFSRSVEDLSAPSKIDSLFARFQNEVQHRDFLFRKLPNGRKG